MAVAALAVLAGGGTFLYFYLHFGKIVDSKLRQGPFANTSVLYAAPEPVMVGDPGTPSEIVAALRRAGYSESSNNRTGWYRLRRDAVEINPGVDSFFDSEGGVIQFSEGQVSRIVSLRDNTSRRIFLLEPELLTSLHDKKREKRRLVQFDEIPILMRHALVAAEDKRFFEHPGVDFIRLAKAAYEDLKSGSRSQGASTLSQQLARSFFLNNERTFKRKLAELFITIHLEQKLSKTQIFEHYCNEIYLGQRGSFSIHGFAQASQAYFGKDLARITLPEAALLAGTVQGPSLYAPWRFPERARKRRNLILTLMRDNKFITEREMLQAQAAPLSIAPTAGDSNEAPYFVDLVNETLQQKFSDYDFQSNGYRVYTTLDAKLQRAAVDAVAAGMKEVDAQLKNDYKKGWPAPQVALVALDAETGEVRALVGGRDYGQSQLNRALAKRQPGSVFKPFVYAAALATAIGEDPAASVTPATLLQDEPTTFEFYGQTYEPGNFGGKFVGPVTVRDALVKSLNIPTVKLAERAGYQEVVNVARRAGMNMQIKATPAVALGAYEVTPVEIAGAYTTFVNNGYAIPPTWIRGIRDRERRPVFEEKPKRQQVLDPRVNFLMVSLLQDVINRGTGAGARSRGFALPAGGKTGTSHDGWFAGFTSKLVCAVWVGFDDNRELPLEGARSALPVWTAFMKRAHEFRQYRSVHGFAQPEGITSADIDPSSGDLAGPGCAARPEYFIEGTQPVNVCQKSNVQPASWDDPPAGKNDKPRGFFGRLRDIIR